MPAAENTAIAERWVDAFNAHDVPSLVALYADDCRHTSPKIRALHPTTGGELVGKPALADWWADSMRRIPSLRYEPTAIIANDRSVVLEYIRHADGAEPMPIAETFDIEHGRIVRSRVYHG